jgi:hypothetical protein
MKMERRKSEKEIRFISFFFNFSTKKRQKEKKKSQQQRRKGRSKIETDG